MALRASLPLCVALCGAAGAPPLLAQRAVTRAQAVEAALARGARAAFGRADTALAAGVLRAARAFPNPSLAATYTKDVPHYHYIADLALDLPWLRSARIGAAASAREAARYGFAFERAAIRFDVDTTYTRALAALAHARLSRRPPTPCRAIPASRCGSRRPTRPSAPRSVRSRSLIAASSRRPVSRRASSGVTPPRQPGPCCRRSGCRYCSRSSTGMGARSVR